ncbi:Peptidyl-prolyl cis-trans isomerase cyp10 [Mortierella claussenii]|nr:Peptidyl-prolyl cis-trans isomerase cyp10 [Mortierella claussenii]
MSVTLHTDLGDLKLEVFCESVPKTAEARQQHMNRPEMETCKVYHIDYLTYNNGVLNFLALCASGYYDNNLFHRNIKGFMVQTGDPTGTGKGGNSIWGKKFPDELRGGLKHTGRGIVSMANSGPDTNGSQFFITYDKQPHLDTKYTIFAKVIDGVDTTLDAIEKIPVDAKNRPTQPIRILSTTIHANPIAERER